MYARVCVLKLFSLFYFICFFFFGSIQAIVGCSCVRTLYASRPYACGQVNCIKNRFGCAANKCFGIEVSVWHFCRDAWTHTHRHTCSLAMWVDYISFAIYKIKRIFVWLFYICVLFINVNFCFNLILHWLCDLSTMWLCVLVAAYFCKYFFSPLNRAARRQWTWTLREITITP